MMVAEMDFALGKMSDSIRGITCRFAIDRIEPISAKVDEEGNSPRQLRPEMGTIVLHGRTVEEEYGDFGPGHLDHVIVCEMVICPSALVGFLYGIPSNLCVNQIRPWTNPDQKAKYLSKPYSDKHLAPSSTVYIN